MLLNSWTNLDRNQARNSCKTSTRSALPAYTRLRSLSKASQSAQPAAEGAAPHLIDHLEERTLKVYTLLKDAASTELNNTLDQMGWPKKELRVNDQLATNWTEQVNTLLDLQEPDLLSLPSNSKNEPSTTEPIILLPIEVMVHPLQLRFRYHFYGNRPTNRLDKPEYFLSHILDLLEDHNGFLLDYFQPILDERSRAVPELDDFSYPDATSAFISALLPMVKAKVLSLLPQISSQPQLLSHFMHELMSFDTTLRDSWAYQPIPYSLTDWKGLTWSLLVMHNYFNTWLKVEKDFALARYESIMSTPDSRDIDYESTESGSTKPTKGAIRVNDLLETITDRYRPLSSFSQKLRFLIEIQLEIFDQYHQRLHGSLERYIMDTSTLGKVIQGSTSTTPDNKGRDDISGLHGLESLCKVFGSAEYLERKMSDWGDDIFFLELWDELQDRARRNAGTDGSVGRDLSTSEVASRTSSTIRQGNEVDGGETDGGALFDETASAYRRLRLKAEEQINELLTNAIIASLRPYSKIAGWSSLDTTTSTLTPTPALDTPLQLLSDLLSFLFRFLAPGPLRRITRQLCLAIQKYIWDNVLIRHNFSASGAAQLRSDFNAISRVIDACINYSGEAARGMRRLNEGIRLLGLPIKPSTAPKSPQKRASAADDDKDAEEGWGFDNDDEDDGGGSEEQEDAAEDAAAVRDEEKQYPADTEDNNNNNKTWSLWEVEKRIFRSNESARNLLSDMGMETLTESDARTVLERRIEVGS
jgi:RAD50-interacting protein 1